MIVKPPENKFELAIFDEIAEGKDYNEFTEGEKSILYDLAISLPRHVHFNWNDVNIPNYVHNCYIGYKKNKNVILIQVIANCINVCFSNKYARLEGGSMYESKHLVITDRPLDIKEVKKDGGISKSNENNI